MQKLFLASWFAEVGSLFPAWIGDSVQWKTVTFIPTAWIPEEITCFIDDDRKAFEDLGIFVDQLEISTASAEEIEDKLKKNDYIFVSGGNVFFLLQEMKRTGTDTLIKKLIWEGKPYIWTSAGSMILSPNIAYWALMDDPEKASDLSDFSALGLVDFFFVPHHTEEPFAELVDQIIEKYADLPLLLLNNKQVACIDGDKFEVRVSWEH